MNRRDFLKISSAFVFSNFFKFPLPPIFLHSPIFKVENIPTNPFGNPQKPNRHAGVDSLIELMGEYGLKFYDSKNFSNKTTGPYGLIGSEDVVLIKVNAQWKYRGATNSDVVRGIIQAILDHPDGFRGEIVVIENGQGRGSLNCDNYAYYGDREVHANSEDEKQSFLYLVDRIFTGYPVSAYLLDNVRYNFLQKDDNKTDGYIKEGIVSYPVFTTKFGNRINLKLGVWNGNEYENRLKLINVPVLKYHDRGGSEYTACLKHFYGVLSMADGYSGYRHYSGLGETCGYIIKNIRFPVLNILDCIWVSYSSLTGYPPSTTSRQNILLASQDPVALDYYAGKNILYPLSKSPYHLPTYGGVSKWLSQAEAVINSSSVYSTENRIFLRKVTRDEARMKIYLAKLG
jgi:uncharacterized protein (DUF362 family)